MVGPERGAGIVDGLVTGFHTEGTSHLALLTAIGGAARVRDAYEEALREEYLWHEFGDVHLLWKPGRAGE
jgi:S-adenosylmethionine:tRNA ribosyltransferase-isomerase